MTATGDTLLSLASMYYRKEFCDWLLQEGAVSNARPAALQAALCPAAEPGNLSLVELLLRNGADVNVLGKNRKGLVASALHFAAAAGHPQTTKYLLEKGAKTDRSSLDLGHVMASPRYTLNNRQAAMKILRLLLDGGADVNVYSGNLAAEAQAEVAEVPVHEHLQLKHDQDNDWGTPLATAVSIRDAGMVQLLLRYGADPNIGWPDKRIHGDRGVLSSSPDIVRLLIEAGLIFDESSTARAANLAAAASHGHIEIVEALLECENGWDMLQEACDGALLEVVRSGSVDMARLLLTKGANVNVYDASAWCTPLMEAVSCDRLEMAEFLVSKGADLFYHNEWGQTALHKSVLHCRSTRSIDWLVELGTPLKVQDMWGLTPLHLAIQVGKGEQSRSLLKHGASPNTRDTHGDSAFDCARSRGDHDLARVMRNGQHIIEEDSQHIRARVLQRSIVLQATQLLNGDWTRTCNTVTDILNDLGSCLLGLQRRDDARHCFQSGFSCFCMSFEVSPSHIRYSNFEKCSICDTEALQEYRQICVTCRTDICWRCFAFLKGVECDSEKCQDHDFLHIPVPSLSDFGLPDTGDCFPDQEVVGRAILNTNRQFLVDLVDRYSASNVEVPDNGA